MLCKSILSWITKTLLPNMEYLWVVDLNMDLFVKWKQRYLKVKTLLIFFGVCMCACVFKKTVSALLPPKSWAGPLLLIVVEHYALCNLLFCNWDSPICYVTKHFSADISWSLTVCFDKLPINLRSSHDVLLVVTCTTCSRTCLLYPWREVWV